MPLLSLRNEGFDPAFKDTSVKENAALTFETFNPYVGTDSDYLPLVAPTGVLFLETDHIAQLYISNHFLASKD